MLCGQEGLDRKRSDKSERQLSLLHHGKAEAQPYWLWLFRARRRNAGKRAGRAPVIGFLDGGGNQSFSYSLFPSQLASAANGFGLLACRLFRGILIEACPLHFSEHAFALHFLFLEFEALARHYCREPTLAFVRTPNSLRHV